jgi:type IV pilus biogenesis protein CpaD/CtpE
MPRHPIASAIRTALLALLAGCATSPAVPARPGRTSPAPPAGIRFLENDLVRAVAEGRASDRPVFVDAWAPW